MEKDFSKDDFAEMQQQAIQRVKEMQQRSKQARESESQGKSKQTGHETEHGQNKKSTGQPPKIQVKTENRQPKSLLSSLFKLDADISLILPLLILLGREGTDDMLLLALLYIMT